jgi:LPXTG-motif cell wall-anchored protein
VYELDDDGKPIKNQAHANANGHNYKVEYSVNNSVGNALVTNNTIRITNTEQQYELPKTGGKGRRNYYLIGTMLVIFSVISLGASKLSRMRRKN